MENLSNLTKIPDKEQILILDQFHNGRLNVHRGIKETVRRIKEKLSWQSLTNMLTILQKIYQIYQETKT